MSIQTEQATIPRVFRAIKASEIKVGDLLFRTDGSNTPVTKVEKIGVYFAIHSEGNVLEAKPSVNIWVELE